MSRRIALFANGKVGLEISQFLLDQGDEVVILSLAGQYPSVDYEIEKVFSGKSGVTIHHGDLRSSLKEFQDELKRTGTDTLITVYWPFLLPSQILNPHFLTVNFHPALLPLNRGWYPHVHNILDGSPAGVTLHEISEEADKGDIWLQEMVQTYPWDLASDLYFRLQEKITLLFMSNWGLIRSGKIQPTPQQISMGNYHSKNEIEELDLIDLGRIYKASNLLDLLRARTFQDKGFAYFLHEGEKIKVKIQFEREEF